MIPKNIPQKRVVFSFSPSRALCPLRERLERIDSRERRLCVFLSLRILRHTATAWEKGRSHARVRRWAHLAARAFGAGCVARGGRRRRPASRGLLLYRATRVARGGGRRARLKRASTEIITQVVTSQAFSYRSGETHGSRARGSEVSYSALIEKRPRVSLLCPPPPPTNAFHSRRARARVSRGSPEIIGPLLLSHASAL